MSPAKIAPVGVAALRRRRRSRGASVFLVTLVMTMLAGLGVFAARATSLSGRASGYLRQSEQSHYLMQHAMTIALNEIDRGSSAYGKRNGDSIVTNQKCTTTAAYPTVALPCVKFSSSQTGADSFSDSVQRAQTAGSKPKTRPIEPPPAMQMDPAKNTPGSLGPWPLLPAMYVEMTDISELDRAPPGTGVSGLLGENSKFKYRQATLVAIAQVGPFPSNGTTAACTDAEERGAATVVSREAGRGQIIFRVDE